MFRFSAFNVLRAVTWMAVSAVTFAASSAAAKLLGQKLPTAELAFFRSALAALFLLGAWHAIGGIRKASDPLWYIIRCSLGVIALYSMMYAFSSIPLAIASLIFFTRVLLLPIASMILIGEKPNIVTWSAAIIGFIGAAISLIPLISMPEFHFGIVAAFIGAAASAGSQTAVRKLASTNDPSAIVMIYTIFSMVATFPLAVPVWITPPLDDWFILGTLGISALVAQYAAARAYALASVPILAPLDFLTVPFAAILGLFLFGEVPSFYAFVGGTLVFAGALLTTSQSHQPRLP